MRWNNDLYLIFCDLKDNWNYYMAMEYQGDIVWYSSKKENAVILQEMVTSRGVCNHFRGYI